MSPATLEFVLVVFSVVTRGGIEPNMMHQQSFTDHQGLATKVAFRQIAPQAILDHNVRGDGGVLHQKTGYEFSNFWFQEEPARQERKGE
jgi:hypothetical protein